MTMNKMDHAMFSFGLMGGLLVSRPRPPKPPPPPKPQRK